MTSVDSRDGKLTPQACGLTVWTAYIYIQKSILECIFPCLLDLGL